MCFYDNGQWRNISVKTSQQKVIEHLLYNLNYSSIDAIKHLSHTMLQVEIHDEIFHFEIFKNFMKILKYFKTPFLKYFMKLLIFNIK